MEVKLAEYRARKAKERQNAESIWQKGVKLFWRTTTNSSNNEAQGKQQKKADLEHTHKHARHEETEHTGHTDEDLLEEESYPPPPEKFTQLLIILKIMLWLLLWAIAIQVQFGAVYFAMSALAFIYINTRTRQRRGQLSAYSVFNPGCERLSGTLTAEQMEQSLFYRRPRMES